MSDHPRRPLAVMRAKADALVADLRPFCERIEIAGSIRRERPEVADVEIVCVPKRGMHTPGGELLPQMCNLLDAYCFGKMEPSGPWLHRRDKNGRPAFGERFKRLLVDGAPVDLFSVVAPAQFGVLFLIRSGPADFSRKMVTQRSKGGYLPDDCRVEQGAVWRDADSGTGSVVIPMPEEADFFALCGRAPLSPRARA